MVARLSSIPEVPNGKAGSADQDNACAAGPVPSGRSEAGDSVGDVAAADMAHISAQDSLLPLKVDRLDEWDSVRMRGPSAPPVRMRARTAYRDIATEGNSSFAMRNPHALLIWPAG